MGKLKKNTLHLLQTKYEIMIKVNTMSIFFIKPLFEAAKPAVGRWNISYGRDSGQQKVLLTCYSN